MRLINPMNDGSERTTAQCPHCGAMMSYGTREQTPGFRMRDSLMCPACGKQVGSSMEVEFIDVRCEDAKEQQL